MGRPESVAAAFFRTEEGEMADIAKVIRVIGQSPTSFAEATRVAVQEAAKTVRDIHGAHVVEMSAVVENEQITLFRTTVDIAFGVER
jgi:flavin-binding protein dodecin